MAYDQLNKQWDLIVVGAGIAGLSAAIKALEHGASVLLLDSAHGGGTSAVSGGCVYAGGGTRHQKEAAVEDTPEAMFEYLKMEIDGAVSDETLKRFCDESVARLEWLEKHGGVFKGSLCPYKTGWPTDDYYLYYSGNEKAWPYKTKAKPAARGHRVVGQYMCGRNLLTPLQESAIRLGACFVPACTVEELVLEDGRVTGVECRILDPNSYTFAFHRRAKEWLSHHWIFFQGPLEWLDARANQAWARYSSKPTTIRADAVVLATGGFGFNSKMRSEHAPAYDKVSRVGPTESDGNGIKLGQAVGGSVSHMDRMSAWRFIAPPTGYLGGVAVSAAGERIGPEDLYGASFTELMIHKHGGKGFVIVDSEQWALVKQQIPEQLRGVSRIPQQMAVHWAHSKAPSLDGLAKKLGISAGGLKSTVEAYNQAVKNGEEEPFHKSSEYVSPIEKGPFYGVDVGVESMATGPCTGMTLGGLRVAEDSGLVLDKEDKVIPGLYAAGRCAVGICSNSYVSGLSLADSQFAGMRAAEHAVASRAT